MSCQLGEQMTCHSPSSPHSPIPSSRSDPQRTPRSDSGSPGGIWHGCHHRHPRPPSWFPSHSAPLSSSPRTPTSQRSKDPCPRVPKGHRPHRHPQAVSGKGPASGSWNHEITPDVPPTFAGVQRSHPGISLSLTELLKCQNIILIISGVLINAQS